jgi:hypothetical protein
VHAELAAVEQRLQECDDPVSNTLKMWVFNFRSMLNQDNLENVVSEYVKLLEEIFSDPLDTERPFNPELFRAGAPPLTRFMIGTMRDRHSLFFSQRIEVAAPSDALPLSLYRVPERLIAGMLRIQAIQAHRHALEVQQMEGVHALRERITRVDADQDAHFAAVAQTAQAGFQEVRENIDALQADIDNNRERLLAAAERLDQEVEQLRAETVLLRDQIEDVRGGISQVERASAQLQVSINEVREELKKQQSGWLGQLATVAAIVVVAVCAQWALAATLPGASASASTTGFKVGMTFTF